MDGHQIRAAVAVEVSAGDHAGYSATGTSMRGAKGRGPDSTAPAFRGETVRKQRSRKPDSGALDVSSEITVPKLGGSHD